MLQQIFRILILFTLVCSIGPWGTLGITHTVAHQQTTAAPFEQKADEVAILPLDAQTTISADIGQSEAVYHFVPAPDGYTVQPAANGMGVQLSAASARLEMGDLTWDLRLQGWGYAGAQTLSQTPELTATENRAEYRYPGLNEWYVNGPFGVQQGFTIMEPPSASQGSQLTLALGLGELQAQVDGDRKGAVVSGVTASTKLNYGGLKAYDATHRPLVAWMETSESSASLLLQVETGGAIYPITVDPLARQVKLTASEGVDDNFGFSVAVSNDGRTALVGAYKANVGGHASQGAVYAFYLDKIITGIEEAIFEWVYQGRFDTSLSMDGKSDDRFGISVALSDNGDIAVVGADGVDWGGKVDQGAAYIFARTSGAWSVRARLLAVDGAAGDKLGWSVALSGTGSTALVGAHGAISSPYTGNGAAYVFTSSEAGGAGSWFLHSKLFRAIGTGAAMGYSVALNSNGDTALLGAFAYDGVDKVDQGLVVVYQLTGGTSWDYKTTLSPIEPVAGGLFGRSVSLSNDGTIALIGASGTQVGENANQGAAYIFTGSGSTWTQKAMLTASDGAAQDKFGVSVALDGVKAYVGAYQADVSTKVDQGAVYLFTLTGVNTNWPQTRKFTAVDGAANDQFGVGVASGGSTLLVGARGASVTGNSSQGAAYTFLPGPHGDELALKLTGCGGMSDAFGSALALSDDGRIALIGAYGVHGNGTIGQGAAYIFTRLNSGWEQSARLVAADAATGDGFGKSVALSGDGHTALVGAPWQDGVGSNSGAAYMFTHTGRAWSSTNWSQLRKIIDTEGQAADYFGSAVALSDDGNIVLVGAPNAGSTLASHSGTVTFFRYSPSITSVRFGGAATGDLFGQAVAVSGDGTTALIGIPGATVGGNAQQGSVHAYKFTSPAWSKQATLNAVGGAANDGFGAQLALSDDGNTALVGVPSRDVSGNVDQGVAYIFTRTNTTWSPLKTLTASNGEAGDQFGSAVALDAGGKIALIGASRADAYSVTTGGVAYSFLRQGTTWTEREIIYGQDNDNGSEYGFKAVLSDTGQTGLITAIRGGGYAQGAVYVVSNPAKIQFVYMPLAKK